MGGSHQCRNLTPFTLDRKAGGGGEELRGEGIMGRKKEKEDEKEDKKEEQEEEKKMF